MMQCVRYCSLRSAGADMDPAAGEAVEIRRQASHEGFAFPPQCHPHGGRGRPPVDRPPAAGLRTIEPGESECGFGWKTTGMRCCW